MKFTVTYVSPSGNILSTSACFGDLAAGNQLCIDENGILAEGTTRAWDDILRPAISAKLYSAAGRIDYNFDEIGVDFQDNADYPDDVLATVIQFRHAWALGTTVSPHFHWFQEQSDTPNWLITHRWYGNGDLVPAVWTLNPIQSHLFTYPGAGTMLQLSDFNSITPPAGLGVSSFLDIKMYRDTGNDSGEFTGADPVSGDVLLKEFDLHILIDSLGSQLEYQKIA